MTVSARVRIVAAVAVGIGLVAGLRFYAGDLESWLRGLGQWRGPVFVGLHVVAVSCFFPVSVLGFLAGILFGFRTGLTVLALADVMTAAIMYGASRRWLSGRRERWLAGHVRWQRFVRLADDDALRIMMLLRLSPLNYGLVNYVLGMSRVPVVPYLVATLLVLPTAALQVFIGSTARAVGHAGGVSEIGAARVVLMLVGALAAVVLLVIVGRLAQRALEEDQKR